MSASPAYQPLIPGAPQLPDSPLVLVVDDDAAEGETMAVDLRRAGLRVRTALNVDYALDFCRTQPFDAAVLDHHPADGYSETLLKEGADMGPAVIVSTATPPLLADIQKRHRKRVFAVRPKPVAPSELAAVVWAAVSRSRSRRRRLTR